MSLRLLVGRKILYINSSYALQTWLSESEKDNFFFNLLENMSVVPPEEMLLVYGYQNDHVGKTSVGFEGILGGHAYGIKNSEGTCVLEICAAVDLVITNTYFTKFNSQLLTYRSGNSCSQIDYIFVRKSDFKSQRDVKAIGSDEYAWQHKLLVRDLELDTTFNKSSCIPPKRKFWRLSDLDVRLHIWKLCSWKCTTLPTSTEFWQSLEWNQNLPAWCKWHYLRFDTCGKARRKETWLWNYVVVWSMPSRL